MNGLYYQIIDITDYGPYVTKLVLGMPRTVTAEEIRAEQFTVYVELHEPNGDQVILPKSFIERDVLVPARGYRPVIAAYPSDRHGRKAGQGNYVTLEMPFGPIWTTGSVIVPDHRNMNGFGHYAVPVCTVTQTSPIGEGDNRLTGLVFDICAGMENPKKDRFRTGVSTHPELPIRYGYYIPEKVEKKLPLILFLHGAGEGGQDLPVTWTANKVTAFTEPENQAKFGGAVVLVPQCETMWLDDGDHVYRDLEHSTGRSMYTEALKYAVDEFVQNHAAIIDTDRIWIGGDSNGGFMTMRMIMSYPEYFAAAFPICEAQPDRCIAEEDIQNLKNIPIWFTQSRDDNVVAPEDHAVPTYHRLIAAGADNVHFTFWDRIEDIHEGFCDETGAPYRYGGHFSWIPMYNDDCRVDFDGQPVCWEGRKVTLMEWLGQQRRR